MAIDPRFLGRQYGPYRYQAGLEKMREFAYVIAGASPSVGFDAVPEGLHPALYDQDAPGGVVAFPTFVVTFAIKPFSAAISDPELGIDLLKLVHGEQELEWGAPIRDGDLLTTTGRITRLFEKARLDFLEVTSESRNQRDERVVKGIWTAVIKP